MTKYEQLRGMIRDYGKAAFENMCACKALAEDMLSVDPRLLPAYKSLIDDGFDRSFGDAMQLEKDVSSTMNSAVSADTVESRREAIRQRGQSQKG